MMKKYRKQQGALFVTSMAIMAVMMIIGTAFLGSSFHQLHSARQAHNALHALVMADAGVNFAIWRQRWSSSPIPVTDSRILAADTDPETLAIDGEIAPAFTLTFGANNEDKFAVWLLKYQRDVSNGDPVKGYQAIARGYYRNANAGSYNRTVRAVLQPPPETPPTTEQTFPQLNYAVYTESDLRVDTSTNIFGNGGGGLGTNGSAYLSTSGGGSINANVYSAGSVTFDKNKTTVKGNVQYGTKILDTKGNDISDNVGASVTGTVNNNARTMLVPEMNSDEYLLWAQFSGPGSIFYDTRISTSDVVKTDILYVNPNKTPGFTLRIDTNIPKAGLVFVNGDVVIGGNLAVGVYDQNGTNHKPFVIVATGSVVCSGTSTINGIVWNKGSFGGGTPTVNGSIICNNVTGFQGNPTMNHRKYTVPVLPCDALNYKHAWRLASWEEVR